MKNKKPKMIRQGDILLIETTIPQGKRTTIKPENGRLILARGEATGHHHSIAATDAELMEINGLTYLDIKAAVTMLDHQEHTALPVAKSSRVVRQREYSPAAIRTVQD